MSDRHPKWTPVEPGHVIPAGQPYRVETLHLSQRASEFVDECPFTAIRNTFVDSSWRPPLELPTEPTWGIVVRPAGRAELGCWEWMTNGSHMLADNTHWFGPRDRADVADFIPLTDEQVARIEAAR